VRNNSASIRRAASPAASAIRLANASVRSARQEERFQAKWTPVRVKKTRQNKNLELRF
jgi:hypothetical protein